MAKRKADPRTIARRAVEAWFQSVCQSPDAFVSGGVFNPDSGMDAAFEDVADAVAAEQGEGQRPGRGDESIKWEMIGREAGYIIGVQVGLRLRG